MLGQDAFELFPSEDLEDFLFEPGSRVVLQVHGGVELVSLGCVRVVEDGEQLDRDEVVRL
ncbi:hypothetical protein [Streptomyces sp. NPDC018036]|uniref:hypothetical protein n=1 Tax=Streptomyces sp. NPDC018036 TaxID=3365035 RepID=UPI00378783A9